MQHPGWESAWLPPSPRTLSCTCADLPLSPGSCTQAPQSGTGTATRASWRSSSARLPPSLRSAGTPAPATFCADVRPPLGLNPRPCLSRLPAEAHAQQSACVRAWLVLPRGTTPYGRCCSCRRSGCCCEAEVEHRLGPPYRLEMLSCAHKFWYKRLVRLGRKPTFGLLLVTQTGHHTMEGLMGVPRPDLHAQTCTSGWCGRGGSPRSGRCW